MAEMGVYSHDKDPAGMCFPRPQQQRPEENMSVFTPPKKLPMTSACYVPGRIDEGPVDPQHCVTAHPHLADDAKPAHPGLRMNPNPEGITPVPPARPEQSTPASQTWWGRAAGKTWSTIQSWFADDHEIEPQPAVADTRG